MSFNNSSVEYLNLSLENPAWEEAEDPDISDAFYIFAIVWLSINLVLGFCVNGLIICVFIREKSLRTPFNYVLMNLIVTEFVMMTAGLPFDIIAAYDKGWKLGYTPCLFLGFLMTSTGMSCIYSLTALSVQRCLLLRYPTSNGQNSFLTTKVAIFIIWFLSSMIAFPPLLGWSEYVPEESGLSCSPAFMDLKHRSYSWYILSLGFFLPVIVIGCSSYLIVIKLKNHGAQIKTNVNKNLEVVHRRERKVTFMVMLMITSFLFAWTGYALVCFLRLMGVQVSPMAVAVAMLLAKVSGLLNAIVFVFMNVQFRNAMKGATTPNRGSGDNLLQNPPEQLLLRQSIMKRIGRSKDSNTNTITSFKRQQSNQLSQSQSQVTAGGYSPPVPRIPQSQIPTIVRMSNVKASNIISTSDSSCNNPKTSTMEPMAICV